MKLGKFELDKIYCGNCRELTKDLPRNSIDMCITSPPYWGLRDYGIEGTIWDGDENCDHEWFEIDVLRKATPGDKPSVKSKVAIHRTNAENRPGKPSDFCIKCGAWRGSLGLEPDFNLYIKHLCDIFDEVKRVLKKEGTCWVNIGDTYHGGNLCVGQPENWESISTINKEKYNSKIFNKFIKDRNRMDYPKKSLIMIPFHFAIEMVNRGWILRNTIIWHKPNCMPSSVKDRFTVDFEYLFFFVKSSTTLYWINSKTYQRVDKQPKGTQGIEGIDWEWKEHLTCKGKGCDNKRCIGGKIKNSFWEGKDYYFEQQFESYSESYLKENRPMGVLRQRLYKESKYQKYEYGSNQFKNKRMLPIGGVKKAGGDNPTYSGNTPFYKKQGRNKRTVWIITTKPFKEAHFAVFPPKLIETPIKAGCPEFVCKKCGKAREKLFDYKRTPTRPEPTNSKYGDKENDIRGGDGIRLRKEVKHIFKGYTNCGCNAGFEGGIVLDPFIGSGTTGLVALKQRKHFIGFEINPEYLEMANKRLKSVQVSML